MTDWQIKQLGCECIIHRYHVAHLCECGKVLDHSQGTWAAHRDHEMQDFDPAQYKHGWGFLQTFDHLQAMGLIDAFSPAYSIIYAVAAEAEAADRNARLNAMHTGTYKAGE